MTLTSKAISLLSIALSTGVVLVATSVGVRADANERCNKYAGQRPDRFIRMCPEVKTSVRPRVARSSFSVHFEQDAAADATGCKLTTWLIMYDRRGNKVGESSRAGKDCTDPVRFLPHPTVGVEQATPTRAYYARARGCVDLYFVGSSHSGWQRCQESEKVGFFR